MKDRTTRKALVDSYKLALRPMGIASITNRVNGKRLIEQSMNLTATFNRHRTELRFGTHRNKALLADWRSHGEANFDFEILQAIEERPEPDFDYAAELADFLAAWRIRIPPGSALSYL
jgi:hypothetical protein